MIKYVSNIKGATLMQNVDNYVSHVLKNSVLASQKIH
jgi:hypothetical protein